MPKKDSNGNPMSKSRGIGRGRGAVANWANASGEVLISAICSASAVGGALRLGYSRDGGAFAVGIYGDGDPYTEFVSPGEDIDGVLRDIETLFADLKFEQEQAQTAKKGSK